MATKLSLKSLPRRILALDEEIAALDRLIAPLVGELAPDLLALEGVGVASAGELMVAAGGNPGRLRSEASFAMLCVCRMRTGERTRANVRRRTGQGLSKREVMRCLERYVARKIYRVLTAPAAT